MKLIFLDTETTGSGHKDSGGNVPGDVLVAQHLFEALRDGFSMCNNGKI